jgi:hypothetical protein
MIFLTLFGTVGVGIYIDGYVIHPPAQYTGICPAPATITHGNCVQSVLVTITRSGTEAVTTQTIQAGTVLLPNGTGLKR